MLHHECALCEGRVLPGQAICAVCLERLAWIPRRLDGQLEAYCNAHHISRQAAVQEALYRLLNIPGEKP
jgi:hypothetical protein